MREWSSAIPTSEIRNPDGSVVFRQAASKCRPRGARSPADILAQKYFRKAGVPSALKPRRGETACRPGCGARSPMRKRLPACRRHERIGSETSAKQVFDRLAGTWTYWGWKGGYFDTEDDARAFYDELCFMLATQKCAPNSPQWFNTGLHWAYGIDGPGQGHYLCRSRDRQAGQSRNPPMSIPSRMPASSSRSRTISSTTAASWICGCARRACSNMAPAPASNFSQLRGENEPLSGGGKSSGLMSFLKIGDRAAGAIKSGGTTRRAAKMVVVDIDHPDIEDYIDWKVKEEQKVAALVTGSKIVKRHLTAIMKACINCEGPGGDCFEIEKNPALKRAVKEARRHMVAGQLYQARHPVRAPGLQATSIFDTYDTDWDGEAYRTVSGQNSNNSVRVTDDFLKAVEIDGDWDLNWRMTARRRQDASRRARCGTRSATRPGPRPIPASSSTPRSMTGTPARQSGEIRASNPCSEYMFLDDTACNLASLNLLQFRDRGDGRFDVEASSMRCGCGPSCSRSRCMMAQFPSQGDRPALL